MNTPYYQQSYGLKGHNVKAYCFTLMLSIFGLLFTALNAPSDHGPILAKSRYSAGLVCQVKGWEFCATWANSIRGPGSRIA
ncbi:hypothetical protein CXF83_12470 [Shewanella sp. Choline-02u-19]|uniref:hypothetical protein n=1 Tax=unclassified Shewanella TaxID=196818 RepID=UPI000C349B84|nr:MULTISPECIES: hypothetical protein [unclassified Shewanella]PKG59172.1 hypothetical protein CXF82_00650 [Shewanella sp. GutDb-MelDb]PKG75320.1 hypothetical protein CXF86_08050 [Shewanella sp. GutCb]PKH57985.1 hypothetical protein CXF84_06800 [Shewanella sp. Bg11-22]PKI27466.1 hypothetical protein CXF83_12470 [Shewanella sp. Choline-02u-19]